MITRDSNERKREKIHHQSKQLRSDGTLVETARALTEFGRRIQKNNNRICACVCVSERWNDDGPISRVREKKDGSKRRNEKERQRERTSFSRIRPKSWLRIDWLARLETVPLFGLPTCSLVPPRNLTRHRYAPDRARPAIKSKAKKLGEGESSGCFSWKIIIIIIIIMAIKRKERRGRQSRLQRLTMTMTMTMTMAGYYCAAIATAAPCRHRQKALAENVCRKMIIVKYYI